MGWWPSWAPVPSSWSERDSDTQSGMEIQNHHCVIPRFLSCFLQGSFGSSWGDQWGSCHRAPAEIEVSYVWPTAFTLPAEGLLLQSV